MSNTYDIGVKFNIATSGGLNKKEKRKEINHNRKQFKIWVARQLDKFDEAENNMDYYDFDNNCIPFDIKEHGIDYINKEQNMIEIFEIIMSAPIELKVIILAGLISPVFLLRKRSKNGRE